MFVEEYFDHLENNSELWIYRSKTLTRDSRSDYIGYFKADLYFGDGSVLFVSRICLHKNRGEKDMYAYHYQNAQTQLIFRYDNTRHFPD